MNGHQIQINGHRIQMNGHQIQMNGHQIHMNGHQNQKQFGRNNHLQTLFYNQFYILSNCNWFRWMIITNVSNWLKQSPPNTILQSFLYSVKLQLILMNGHRKHIKLVETITSKHYFTINSIFCQIATDFDEWSSKTYQIGQNNHLQTLYHTLQDKPSQECKRMWERKKDVLALSSHSSGSSQLCASFLVSVKISMKL